MVVHSAHLDSDLEVLVKPLLLVSEGVIRLKPIDYEKTITVDEASVEPEVEQSFGALLVLKEGDLNIVINQDLMLRIELHSSGVLLL